MLTSVDSALGMTLSEIMFDPLGDEGTDEFVELYNETTLPVNLSGWTLSDGEGNDEFENLGDGLTVAPGQYVLVLDPGYLEDGSTTYDGLVPESALVITIDNATFGSRGFSNSTAEEVTLSNPQGMTIADYTYSTGNEQGFSDEKVLLDGGDGAANWSDSRTLYGSPGARNSVTPPNHDLAITELTAIPEHPAQGESFELMILVQNLGLLPASDSLFLYETGAETDEQRVADWYVAPLSYLEEASYHFVSALGSEQNHLAYRAALASADDDNENNERTITVGAAGQAGQLLLNEIMCRPQGGRAEWIEIVNVSGGSLALDGWAFADGHGIADTTERIYLPALLLSADSFLVIASDSTIFFEAFPQEASVIVPAQSFPALNNGGDSLVLFNATGESVERVDYRPHWGADEAGTSLERISVASAANDPTNWASSLDSSGATPGRVNSRAQSAQLSSGQLLTLTPNPFSPDDDGHDDVLAIQYELDHADSRLDIKIFDTRGREVRRLANNDPVGSFGQRLWDGRDDERRILPTGLYMVYLEALGQGGTRVQSDKRAVALVRRR